MSEKMDAAERKLGFTYVANERKVLEQACAKAGLDDCLVACISYVPGEEVFAICMIPSPRRKTSTILVKPHGDYFSVDEYVLYIEGSLKAGEKNDVYLVMGDLMHG